MAAGHGCANNRLTRQPEGTRRDEASSWCGGGGNVAEHELEYREWGAPMLKRIADVTAAENVRQNLSADSDDVRNANCLELPRHMDVANVGTRVQCRNESSCCRAGRSDRRRA